QCFCAMILDKVRSLIQSRHDELQKLDTLIKSRFVEMFGDPIGNSMGLRTIPLGAACYLKAGITTSADAIHEYSTDYSIPCYGGNGIRGYVKEATQCGCYPIIGRQGALCGNIQLAMGEFHATEHAVLVTPLIEINVVWLFHLLKLMDLYRFHTGAAQPGLAVKTLNTVDIPIADIVEQDRFATFVRSIDKLKSHFLKLPVFPGLSVVKYVY
ncbi:MAG: restriction endonuclease subunit S, partial [Clostridiales bacterium]|nr:restriction endonuclease subunit S [Clostridiales bacterium]